MCNWAVKTAKACQPLLELLEQEIRSGPLINIDETTVQVLREPGRLPTTKSYMWICRGGAPARPGLLFQYAPSRSSNVAKGLLGGYNGIVQSDGYSGYNYLDLLPNTVHAGCWAHARRKFTDAAKGQMKGKKNRSVDVALNYIRRIYAVEKEGRRRELSHEKFIALRSFCKSR